MRIGMFTDSYPPYINGVSTSILMLKMALEKKGHQVFVVTVNNEITKYKYEENGKIIRIPGIPTGIYDYRLSGIYPVRCINKIKKWKLDIIHSHTEFGVGTFARIIAKQFNIPLVHTYHTMYEDYIHYITKGYFDQASKKIVEHLTLFYCDKTISELIVPTKKAYDLFKEKYKVDRNVHIIPTGIDVERFYKEKFSKSMIEKHRQQLGIKENDFIILFVGRLAKEKNIEFLIDAQKDISKKYPNSKLLIIGDGPDMNKYKSMIVKLGIKDNVIFTGKVPYDIIPNYYQLASVFVTASKTETQGLTIIEAMGASKVPVCIDDESFKSMIIDDLNGKIFKNKRQYKSIIFNLIENPDELKRLSLQARRNSQQYSPKYFAERILDVYKIAIDNAPKNKYRFVTAFKDFMKGNE